MVTALVVTLALLAPAQDPADGPPLPIDVVQDDAAPDFVGDPPPPPDAATDDAPPPPEAAADDALPPPAAPRAVPLPTRAGAPGVYVHTDRQPLDDASLLTAAAADGAGAVALVGALLTTAFVVLALPGVGMLATVAAVFAVTAAFITPGLAGLGAGAAVLLLSLDGDESDWQELIAYVGTIYLAVLLTVAAVASVAVVAGLAGAVFPGAGLGSLADPCLDLACHLAPPIVGDPKGSSSPPSDGLPPDLVSGPTLGAMVGVTVGMAAGSALGLTGVLEDEALSTNSPVAKTALTAGIVAGGALLGAGLGASIGAALEMRVVLEE